ncbi:hypothetical protein, partial [Escherichia coli]
ATLSSLALTPALACDCADTPATAQATAQLAAADANNAPASSPAAPRSKLDLVRIQGAAPTSLPTNIPTT